MTLSPLGLILCLAHRVGLAFLVRVGIQVHLSSVQVKGLDQAKGPFDMHGIGYRVSRIHCGQESSGSSPARILDERVQQLAADALTPRLGADAHKEKLGLPGLFTQLIGVEEGLEDFDDKGRVFEHLAQHREEQARPLFEDELFEHRVRVGSGSDHSQNLVSFDGDKTIAPRGISQHAIKSREERFAQGGEKSPRLPLHVHLRCPAAIFSSYLAYLHLPLHVVLEDLAYLGYLLRRQCCR